MQISLQHQVNRRENGAPVAMAEASGWNFQKRTGLEEAAGCMFLDLKDNEIRLALCSNHSNIWNVIQCHF